MDQGVEFYISIASCDKKAMLSAGTHARATTVQKSPNANKTNKPTRTNSIRVTSSGTTTSVGIPILPMSNQRLQAKAIYLWVTFAILTEPISNHRNHAEPRANVASLGGPIRHFKKIYSDNTYLNAHSKLPKHNFYFSLWEAMTVKVA